MALVGQDGLTALMKVGADFRLLLAYVFRAATAHTGQSWF